ncbi:MAG: methyltransferase domain-containing protein [Chloroflexi bacterium]|nr:methyltransferase domain-containing protein [Chloroflexota bacterium]
MTESTQDHWARWLLHRRHNDDPERMKKVLKFLYPVRDKVLSNAKLNDGETLLDVGSGDGLIAFGALEKVRDSQVIFSDISQDLLDHIEALAREMGVLDRCRFLRASADDLSAIPNSSVDAVTTRSVLIYVASKQQSFNEFYRALKPGGRLSIFEPINRFGWPPPPGWFSSYDVTPVADIAAKVQAVNLRLQPPDSDPMLDFDERDMLRFTEKAGFKSIEIELQAKIAFGGESHSWEKFLQFVGNPKIPSTAEAMAEALTPEEAERFTAHLRPLVEAGQSVERTALMYLWAVK